MQEEEEKPTSITALEDGPLMVKGNFEIIDQDFNKLETGKSIYLCRCGGSSKKPLCDGTHNKNGFKG